MRIAPRVSLIFSGILLLLQPTIPATASQTTTSAPPKPSISCPTTACPRRSAHDICHFGKVEWWTEYGSRRTRYNLYCEPACIPAETTCWISGFPVPGQDNFIHWTTGKRPKDIYPYDLRKSGQGFALELVF